MLARGLMSSVYEEPIKGGLGHTCVFVGVGMPRTMLSEIPWSFSCGDMAHAFGFALRSYVAQRGGRKLTKVDERVENQGTCEERVRTASSTARCLVSNVAKTLRHIVKTEDLMSRVTANWYTHKHDEAHAAEFVVEVLKMKDRVKISGQQWAVDQTTSTCLLYTRVKIEVTVFAVGGIAEAAIEKDMRTALCVSTVCSGVC